MSDTIRPRHPLLVLVWSFGILIAMNLHQYLGVLIGAMMGGFTFEEVISGKGRNLFSQLGHGVTAVVIGLPLAWLIIRFLWRRSFDWMRLRFNGRLALGGFALGLLLPLAVLTVISAVGNVNVTAVPSRLTAGDFAVILAGTLCWMSFIAFSEETVFRGMVVREWASRWGWKAATLLGGLWFGALHLTGIEGGLTFVSAIWVLIAGVAVTVLFVALYVRGRSLWLPIGFHLGWNLCLDGLLGVTISGKEPGFSLFQMNTSGPAWLTGGAFGMEASVVAIAVYLAVAILVLRLGRPGGIQILNPRPEGFSEQRVV
ncbi:hypothetical protein C3F09_09765 [candidate division GN15 bacterium]|uniref:CAAX prenyl protease 2/Lysostaphin resistance protein A-like domain-containing protein n=1 Tax=candidate division GN15 bacterium TaxID=2072418 RepID=A0A855X1W9_9BACT|nr:MAG: hypothetical protein C3F09_09765 [candidate division GN15 bacterium]